MVEERDPRTHEVWESFEADGRDYTVPGWQASFSPHDDHDDWDDIMVYWTVFDLDRAQEEHQRAAEWGIEIDVDLGRKEEGMRQAGIEHISFTIPKNYEPDYRKVIKIAQGMCFFTSNRNDLTAHSPKWVAA